MASGATTRDESIPDETHDLGPPPLQFRLKTLLALTAVLSLAFATMGRLSAVWSAALGWFLLLVIAHVAANAMQTRATNHATLRRRHKSVSSSESHPFDLRQACAPTTRLGNQTRLGYNTAAFVGVGAVIGGVVGTMLIVLHNHGELGPPAFFLAAVSSTGIGAFLSFLAGSCAKVTSKAFREATTSADRRD